MRRLLRKENNNMKLVYALEQFPTSYSKSIFLAGPTPRDSSIKSWRPEAIKYLEELGYDGVVFIPEPRDNNFTKDYDKQIDWENEGLNRADCILFWVPRDLETMPAFTTNVEWGMWYNSGKVVIGFPEEAPKNKYLKYQAEQLQLNINNTLKDTVSDAINIIGDGAHRKNGECYVPLYIWNTPMFQNWYLSQISVGNELRYAKVNYLFKMPKAKKVFLYILHVHVYIKSENRIKENEFVLSRTDICSSVLYKLEEDILDTKIVLVREFRSPVSNSECMVYELPGGSSIKDSDNLQIIYDEIKEEVGIELEKNKLKYEYSKQLMSTLSSHKCHLYSYSLSDSEFEEINKTLGIVHGVEEDSERTYTEIFSLKDIVNKDLVDWSSLGMIFSIINNLK